MKRYTFLLLAAAACLILSGCNKGASEPEASKATATTGTTPTTTPVAEAPKTPEGWTEIKSNGFSLSFPKNWKAVDLDPANYQASADAAFGTDPKFKQARITADNNAKAGQFKVFAIDGDTVEGKFVTNLNISVVPAQAGTMDQILEASKGQFDSMSPTKDVKTSVEKISYGDAGLLTATIKAAAAPFPVCTRLYIVKFSNDFVVITFSSNQENADKAASDAKAIMDTFKAAS